VTRSREASASSPPRRRPRAAGAFSHVDVVAVIALGGALGGLGRWFVSEALPASEDGFPWGTFTANVSGGLLLGALMVFLVDVWPPGRYARPFLGVGVLGGFTTFSTYTSEIRDLLLDGRVPLALAYLSGTVVLCLAATWVGVLTARVAAGVRRPRERRSR
jgi:CrcB protein